MSGKCSAIAATRQVQRMKYTLKLDTWAVLQILSDQEGVGWEQGASVEGAGAQERVEHCWTSRYR